MKTDTETKTHVSVDLPKGLHTVDTCTVAARRHHVHTHTPGTDGSRRGGSTCRCDTHKAAHAMRPTVRATVPTYSSQAHNTPSGKSAAGVCSVYTL